MDEATPAHVKFESEPRALATGVHPALALGALLGVAPFCGIEVKRGFIREANNIYDPGFASTTRLPTRRRR